MNALDLFSDIGCHAIGFERAGIKTVAFCESVLWRNLVIADNWPDLPVWTDIRKFNGVPADIVIGDRPARKRASVPPSTASAAGEASGGKCSAYATWLDRPGLSWSSPREMRRGKPKSLAIFAGLAGMSGDLSLALATLVRRIFAGECSWLPAPACRDWRSPGLRSHARLKASRGQQMPEVIGTRISSQLYEWMLALPPRWTIPVAFPHSAPDERAELKPLAMRTRRTWQRSSAAPSCKPKPKLKPED